MQFQLLPGRILPIPAQKDLVLCNPTKGDRLHPASDILSLVYISSNIAEQQAIATILTKMDDEITALEAKKAKYEAIKQGMMQQLLTGKIRLIS